MSTTNLQLTQTSQATQTSGKVLKIRVNLWPEWLEAPALQAYACSPYWHPVATANGVVFVWWSPNEVESVFPVAYGPWKYALMFRSRTGKRLYIAPVGEVHVPGGRFSNLTKEFEVVYNASALEFAIASLLTGSVKLAKELLSLADIIYMHNFNLNYIAVRPKRLEALEDIKKLIIVPFEEEEEQDP